MKTRFFLTITVLFAILFIWQGAAAQINYFSSNINQPVTVNITTQPQAQNKCLGSSVTFTVAVTGTAPVSYQWEKGGVDIFSETSDTYAISGLTLADEGIYTCEVTNLCRTVASNNAELKVIQLSVDAGSDLRICDGHNAQLQVLVNSNHSAESGIYSYTWSPATGLSEANIYNPESNTTVTTDYSVNIIDEVGCSASDSVNVLVQNVFQNEQICLVTVDTIAWKNKVMWEGTPDVGTAKYWIYKEVVTGVYNWIGEILYGSPTFLIDNASNPESHSDRYKITVIDTCGHESVKSMYHNTMNLVISVFGSTMGLVWTEYETEDGSYIPDQYYIYKGHTPQDMTLLTTVTGSQNTYNDVNVFDLQYYMIGAQRDCNVYPTYSNKRDNGLVGVNATSLAGTILISPNPMTTSATLTIPNFSDRLSVISDQYTITDITGKIVRSEPLTPDRHSELEVLSMSKGVSESPNAHITLERGNLKPGIYFVEFKADRIYRGKLVVE